MCGDSSTDPWVCSLCGEGSADLWGSVCVTKMAAIRRACCRLQSQKGFSSVSSIFNGNCNEGPLQSNSFRYSTTVAFSYHQSQCCKLGKHKMGIKNSSRCIHRSSANNKQDYYQVLGVSKSADAKDIKKAYYQVLSDENKRRDYDTFGMSGAGAGPGAGRASGFGGQQGYSGFEHFHSNIDPEELFRQMFGNLGNSGFKFSGFDNFNDFEESKYGFAPAQEIILDLTFTEAARGVNKEVYVNVKDDCPKCGGKKAEPGTKPKTCPRCKGSGVETISTGPFVMRSTCRQCFGAREIISVPCTDCKGKGKIVLRKKVGVPVPAGIEDGQTIRLSVAKSRIFRREGADIHSDATISLSQAVLGGSIRIPGIYDDILLNIPQSTQSHHKIRLSGKGMSRVNSYGYGDHYVHIKIKVPQNLSSQQKALILAFAETEKDVDGTVNGVIWVGIRKRQLGKLLMGMKRNHFLEKSKEKFLDDFSKFATDEDGLVAEIREMLNDINNNGQKTGENTG
ncbi:hypothetical protein KUTeg_024460 [Tegillarca granosa]|uniref:CR-type domain-containing protein n=1 Tax=Tegillarca granosa TaxID=220873 RepID=A0ABQ9E1F6_TEGGR|nr:hypothetical protein KUTeg_024460 [Tegillarca granosa]